MWYNYSISFSWLAEDNTSDHFGTTRDDGIFFSDAENMNEALAEFWSTRSNYLVPEVDQIRVDAVTWHPKENK